MKEDTKLGSYANIKKISRKDADKKQYLTRQTLSMLHLMPSGEPIAFELSEDGQVIYYFDPNKVVEAPPELWYAEGVKKETMELASGTVIERMSVKNGAAYGFFTAEKLAAMNYEIIEEPVAYTYKSDRSVLFLYDRRTAKKLPLKCVKCGESVRYKRKMCRGCFEEDLARRKAEGDIHREAHYNMSREKVLFFDLELTGFYDHDEILSITVIDGRGTLVLDTLVKPAKKKKWTRTEKIHGITPDMVENAPPLEELIPTIRALFDNSENVIAYGISTDYSHIKFIYEDKAEQQTFHSKIRCCAGEFVRYIQENRPDLVNASLIDAMTCFGIEWEGVPHSSVADTIACRMVWEKLFPNYYAD